MTPHKHHDLIVAWAKGATIQLNTGDAWVTDPRPKWSVDHEYRIKREPKPDVVIYKYISTFGVTYARDNAEDAGLDYRQGMHGYLPNLKLTLDGETGKLKKAEVIDEA